MAKAARWFPDGRSIVFTDWHALYRMDADGTNLKKIWDAPASEPIDDLCISPDAQKLAANVAPSSGIAHFWMLGPDGGNAHPLELNWPKDAGQWSCQWTPDGKHFLFISKREGHANVYEVISPRWFEFWKKPAAVRLTGNQIEIEAAAPARDGKSLFVIGKLDQGSMQALDTRIKKFIPYLDGFPALEFVISPDRQWMAYTEYPTGHLWKSRLDGSESLQLTTSPAYMEQWSPDGKWLAYSDWSKLYLISADGRAPEKLISTGDGGEVAPSWFPDGKSIAFNYYPYPDRPLTGIHVFDLATRKLSVMPGSEGYYVPSWSPDGKYLVAIAQNPSRMVLFSAETKTWSDLKKFDLLWGFWIWAPDSKSLYMAVIGDRTASTACLFPMAPGRR